MLIGSNMQGAVSSLAPPCTGAAVMARGFIWPLDSVFFHFVTCRSGGVAGVPLAGPGEVVGGHRGGKLRLRWDASTTR